MVINLIGGLILMPFAVLLAYYTASTLLGGLLALSLWDFSYLEDVWFFWNEPMHPPVIRLVSWFISIGAGLSVVKKGEENW